MEIRFELETDFEEVRGLHLSAFAAIAKVILWHWRCRMTGCRWRPGRFLMHLRLTDLI